MYKKGTVVPLPTNQSKARIHDEIDVAYDDMNIPFIKPTTDSRENHYGAIYVAMINTDHN